MNNFSGDSLDYTILYRTAANAIKRAFPKVKVGGYTSLGFGAQNRVTDDEELRGAPDYAAEFLSGISKGEGEAPLDFFTWSAAPATPEELVLHSKYARLLLKEHAPKAKSIISSFTLAKHEDATAADYLAAMLVGEKCDLDAMLYKYTETCEAKEWADAFFSELSGYGTLAEISDDYRGEIYALAAADADGGAALFATDKFSGAVELFTFGDTMRTFDITELSQNEAKEYKRASVSGREIASGKVMFAVKPKSVYLLKFSN